MIQNIKKRALHRTKILQGQIKGLEKMIVEEKYCIDIIIQSLAIGRSLRSLNKLILENHLRTHVAEKLKTRDSRLKTGSIKELLELYELSNVRG